MNSRRNGTGGFGVIGLLFLIAIALTGFAAGAFSLPYIYPQTGQPNPSNSNSTGPRTGPPPEFSLKITEGYTLGVFAKNTGKVRDLVFSPGGTLLASVPQENKIIALPDQNKDGIADKIVDVITNLANPHGIAFHNGKLFIAEEARVARFTWDENSLTAQLEKPLFDLPAGGDHTSRSITFNTTGQLFVSIGSTCNVCFEEHNWRAAVIVSDAEGMAPQLYAKGLRNAVFLAIHPVTNELWSTEMGRDYLGDTAPPDEINIIQSNRDYGWPLCWGDKNHDNVFDKNQYIRDPCANTESPQFDIAAHSAPLGLTFVTSSQFPSEWQNDVIVSYHGSWNRTTPIGYTVNRLDLVGNEVVAEEEFISGFRSGNSVFGRPVDVIFDAEGSLFISDDHGQAVYKVIAK